MIRCFSSDELERLLRLDCDWATAYEWLFHLFSCVACRQRLRVAYPVEGEAFLSRVFRSQDPPESAEPELAPATLGRLHAEGAQMIRERVEAPDLLTELLRHPPHRRTLLVLNSRRFQTLGLVLFLLEATREAWHEDAARALELAELNLEIAGQLDRKVYDPRLINDVTGSAWAYLANSRRIQSDLRAAERAFERAASYLDQGTGDPLDRARLLDLKSSLLRAQRRFDAARQALTDAIALYRGAGDLGNETRLSVQEGMLLFNAGRVGEAIAVLSRVCEGLEPGEVEERLYFAAHHNLAIALTEAGRGHEAAAQLPGLRGSAGRLGGTLDLVRVEWLEARLCRAQGQDDRAEALLRAVRDAFVDAGIGYDAALVSLDLAGLYLEARRVDEARRLATEMVPIFLSRDVHREACAALMILRDAMSRETASTALVREIAQFLKQARRRPTLKYSQPN